MQGIGSIIHAGKINLKQLLLKSWQNPFDFSTLYLHQQEGKPQFCFLDPDWDSVKSVTLHRALPRLTHLCDQLLKKK